MKNRIVSRVSYAEDARDSISQRDIFESSLFYSGMDELQFERTTMKVVCESGSKLNEKEPQEAPKNVTAKREGHTEVEMPTATPKQAQEDKQAQEEITLEEFLTRFGEESKDIGSEEERFNEIREISEKEEIREKKEIKEFEALEEVEEHALLEPVIDSSIASQKEAFIPTYVPFQQWMQLRDFGMEKLAEFSRCCSLFIVTDKGRLVTQEGQLLAEFKKRKDALIIPGIYQVENGRASRVGQVNNQTVLREAKLFNNTKSFVSGNSNESFTRFLMYAFSMPEPMVKQYLSQPCLMLVAGDLSKDEPSIGQNNRQQTASKPSFPNNARIRGASHQLIGAKSQLTMLIKDEKNPEISDSEISYHWEVWDLTDVEILPETACTLGDDGEYHPKSGEWQQLGRPEGLCVSPFHRAKQQHFHWRESAALEYLNNKLLGLESIWHLGASLIPMDPSGQQIKRNQYSVSFDEAGRYIVRCIASHKIKNKDGKRLVRQYVATHNLRVRDLKKIADEELDKPIIDIYELKLRIRHIQGLPNSSPAKSLLPDLQKELLSRRLIARGTTLGLFKNRLEELNEKLDSLHDEEATFGVESNGSELFALERKIDDLSEHLQVVRSRLKKLFEESGEKVLRLPGILVSDVTGETYRLVLQISEPYLKGDQWICLVSDVTTKEGKVYRGSASAGQGEGDIQDEALASVWSAIEKFTKDANYGSGVIKIRLPNLGWYQSLMRKDRERYFDIEECAPAFARSQLLALGAAASLLGLVVSSPTLQFAGSVVGVGIAGVRIVERVSSGEFQWDSQAINDLMSVLGFGVGML